MEAAMKWFFVLLAILVVCGAVYVVICFRRKDDDEPEWPIQGELGGTPTSEQQFPPAKPK